MNELKQLILIYNFQLLLIYQNFHLLLLLSLFDGMWYRSYGLILRGNTSASTSTFM